MKIEFDDDLLQFWVCAETKEEKEMLLEVNEKKIKHYYISGFGSGKCVGKKGDYVLRFSDTGREG